MNKIISLFIIIIVFFVLYKISLNLLNVIFSVFVLIIIFKLFNNDDAITYFNKLLNNDKYKMYFYNYLDY